MPPFIMFGLELYLEFYVFENVQDESSAVIKNIDCTLSLYVNVLRRKDENIQVNRS